MTKDLTLWKKALLESEFCEPHLVDEVAAGFELAGTAAYSPQFPFEVRPASFSPEMLKSSSVWRSRASYSKHVPSVDASTLPIVWQKSLEE
eukprot:3010184-Amphidinium_carterae.1